MSLTELYHTPREDLSRKRPIAGERGSMFAQHGELP